MMVANKISTLTVSIHGTRGAGKSTVMDMLKSQLDIREIYYEQIEPHISDKNTQETIRVYIVHKPLAAKPTNKTAEKQ